MAAAVILMILFFMTLTLAEGWTLYRSFSPTRMTSMAKKKTGVWIERSKPQQTRASRSTYGKVTFRRGYCFGSPCTEGLIACEQNSLRSRRLLGFDWLRASYSQTHSTFP